MLKLQGHEFPHKISKIIVQHSKEHIVGVKFEYKCGPHHHEVTGDSSTHWGLFDGLTTDDFSIHDDDYIMEIFGYAGLEIN
jgi:hypothetical protein